MKREIQHRMQELLRESMQHPNLHEALLVNYVTAVVAPASGATSDQGVSLNDWGNSVCHMAQHYRPTARVWETLFDSLSRQGTSTEGHALELVFGYWREKDCFSATLQWAGWLMRNGQGSRAAAVVVEGKRRVSNESLSAELEQSWVSILGSVE